MAITVSTVPFAVFGKRAERLHRGASVYVLLAGIGLATFLALETARMLHTQEIALEQMARTRHGPRHRRIRAWRLRARADRCRILPPNPRPLRPYVEPEYRLQKTHGGAAVP